MKRGMHYTIIVIVEIIISLFLSSCRIPYPPGDKPTTINPTSTPATNSATTPEGMVTPSLEILDPPPPLSTALPTNQSPFTSGSDTGIIFLIDRSESENGVDTKRPVGDQTICKVIPEQQNLRYQVPEFVISLLSAYYSDKSSGPSAGVIEFGSTISTTLPLKPVQEYKTTPWASTLWKNATSFSPGNNYLEAINTAQSAFSPEIKNRIIVLISDGSFYGSKSSDRSAVESRLDELKDEMTTVLMIRTICEQVGRFEIPDSDDLNMWNSHLATESLAYEADPFRQAAQFIINEFFIDQQQPSRRFGWIQQEMTEFAETTPGDTLTVNVQAVVVGVSEVKLLENDEEDLYIDILAPRPALNHMYTNEADKKVEGGSCQTAYHWRLEAVPNLTDPRYGNLFGFYWWDYTRLVLPLTVWASDPSPSFNKIIYNNMPFLVGASIQDGNHRPEILAKSPCYKVRLDLFMGSKEIHYPEQELKNSLSFDFSWLVKDFDRLTNPQVITTTVSLLYYQDGSWMTIDQASDTVGMLFRPELSLSNSSMLECPPNSGTPIPCFDAKISISYLGANFYPDQEDLALHPTVTYLTSESPAEIRQQIADCNNTSGNDEQDCDRIIPDEDPWKIKGMTYYQTTLGGNDKELQPEIHYSSELLSSDVIFSWEKVKSFVSSHYSHLFLAWPQLPGNLMVWCELKHAGKCEPISKIER